MVALKIARMGHPILASISRPVDDPTAPEIHRLVADMLETMEVESGAGLAAPQVFVPLRLVIFWVPAERNNGVELPLTVLINPQIEPVGEEVTAAFEGCLSLPGFLGLVPRFHRIRYQGVDLAGQEVNREAEGFHARVVQHECDHLDGILYPMRIADLTMFGFADEIRQRFVAEPEKPQDT